MFLKGMERQEQKIRYVVNVRRPVVTSMLFVS
jgi:hypothetical protein